ncbi:hypothetical protein CLV84_2443 [Neolewinella xylanilytica]|uniref:Uncharacterized protein n=1 Tax=Neolewinella xylanilytica TaxID=1514080 RepID=A0A2S6I2X8_9BACT|nr:hypothetical protein CLV84_2443 [Neolewinella xylanilytica]
MPSSYAKKSEGIAGYPGAAGKMKTYGRRDGETTPLKGAADRIARHSLKTHFMKQ